MANYFSPCWSLRWDSFNLSTAVSVSPSPPAGPNLQFFSIIGFQILNLFYFPEVKKSSCDTRTDSILHIISLE